MVKNKLVKGTFALITVALISVSIILVTQVVAENRDPPSNLYKRVLTLETRPEIDKPITLHAAWDIAFRYAEEWKRDAAIYGLMSSDIDEISSQPSEDNKVGGDGKRITWIAYFVSPQSNLRLRVQITNGVIVKAIEEEGYFGNRSFTEKPILDSPEALRIILSGKEGFSYGDGKGKGFHFYLLLDENNVPVIKVMGSHQGSPAVGIVDVKTGSIISYQKYLTDNKGAVLFSSDAGATWNTSNLTGKMVTSIAPDSSDKSKAYASVIEGDRIQIYMTRDQGRSWEQIAQLPHESATWAFNLATGPISKAQTASVIVVGTSSGLWYSSEPYDHWERSLTLPDGPAQWISSLCCGERTGYMVSITAGPNAGVYWSVDLVSWKRKTEGTFRLSRSYDRRYIITVDESTSMSGGALLFDGEKISETSSPQSILRMAGDFSQGGSVLAESPGAILKNKQDESGKNLIWEEVFTTRLASLAVSPNYPSDGVAIAGGFRTGVFRSTDYGGSWKEVINYQSLAETGTGEISAVEFLSSDHVILINGGTFTWVEF